MASAGRKPLFRLYDDEGLASFPDLTWLVEGVIPSSAIVALVAPPARYKTFIALDIAMRVATGTPWQGRTTAQGDVVYVAAEGHSGYLRRIESWKTVAEFDGTTGVRFITEAVYLTQMADVHRLIESVKAAKLSPRLFVFDTLARCIGGGDENSAEYMGRVIQAFDLIKSEFGATVLPIHHTGKSGETERGSSAFRGGVDVLIHVRGIANGPVTLECEKMKDAAPFKRIGLRLREVGNSAVIEASDVVPAAEQVTITSSDIQVLRLLREEPRTFTTWLNESDNTPSTFKRRRTKFLELGVVQEDEDGLYELTKKGRRILMMLDRDTSSKRSTSPTHRGSEPMDPPGKTSLADEYFDIDEAIRDGIVFDLD
jgi:hypothetical protein